MAVGSYGTVRPADVSPADVEIFYHYVSGRTSTAPVQIEVKPPAKLLILHYNIKLNKYNDLYTIVEVYYKCLNTLENLHYSIN